MKHLYLMTLLITSTFVFSQDCKYQRNEVDEFTKNKIIETKFEWLGEQTGYTLKKINNTQILAMYLESFNVFSIKDGAKIMFLTEKEDPITLIFPKYEISKRGKSSEFYISENIILSNKEYERLQNETISKVRFYTTDGYIEKNVKEKRASKFRDQLKCIN